MKLDIIQQAYLDQSGKLCRSYGIIINDLPVACYTTISEVEGFLRGLGLNSLTISNTHVSVPIIS
jgi:hypothetical protein